VVTWLDFRRERGSDIVNLTLTEVMILMVFAALIFSFLARDEGEGERTRLAAEVEAVSSRLRAVSSEKEHLQTRLDGFAARIAQLETALADRDRQIKDLNETIERIRGAAPGSKPLSVRDSKTSGRGSGLPRCSLTAAYLLDVTLLDSGGFAVQPAWDQTTEHEAAKLPGMAPLLATSHLSMEDFRRQAREIYSWSSSQEEPCRFYVRARTRTMQLAVYQKQMKILESYFYILKVD